MAARLRCVEYTFSDTTPVSLTTVLGLNNVDFISTLVMRTPTSNDPMVVYWGGPTMTASTNRGGFLEAGDAIGIDIVGKFFPSSELYLAASAGTAVVHISWIQ
jgi:hypothetical protein